MNEIHFKGFKDKPPPKELKRIEAEVDRNILASKRAAGASREDFAKEAIRLAKKAKKMQSGRAKSLHQAGALGHAVESVPKGGWKHRSYDISLKHKEMPRGIKALESTSVAEQLEYIKNFLSEIGGSQESEEWWKTSKEQRDEKERLGIPPADLTWFQRTQELKKALRKAKEDAKKKKRGDSSTEYEGPSLSEIGTPDMDPKDPVIDAKWVLPPRVRSKRSERARGQSVQKTKKTGLISRIIKKFRGRESIEYEGPSLVEQLEYIKYFLEQVK